MSNSRKAVRQALAGLLTTAVTQLVAVYDHETADFGGRSPVAMVYSDGTAPGPAETYGQHDRQHAMLISLWWLRTDDDATEDYMDDLSEDVIDVVEGNDEQAQWARMWLDDGFSQMDYPIVDGKMYRREVLRVILW
jgi:hypothetical protein